MNASELILNPDGSIYHLGLRPEQVAPLIVTVGDPDRVPKVSRYFDRVEHRVRKREFVTHTGWLGRTRLSVISTGIGTDNVDIVLNELDALVNLDFAARQPKPDLTALTFIRIGTTGGLQPDVPVDAWVASSAAFGMDGLLHFYDAPQMHDGPALRALRQHCAGQWHFPLSPYFAEGDAALLGAFREDFRQGITATNSGFYGPQGRRLRAAVAQPAYLDVLQTFDFQGNKILNLEMETAGIYGLSRLLGHRAVSLSAILANRARGEFSRQPGKTMRRLIEAVLEKISAGV
jgi:uridine phosphorylase